MRGKVSDLLGSHNVTKDHPRLCGEKLVVLFFQIILLGSPPPMRGKGSDRKAGSGKRRITPAYAGKSVHDRHNAIHCWDHPRLCGEKVSLRAFAVPLLGSPPPMRGKDHVCDEVTKHFRITPAYAGKSSFFFARFRC